MINQPASGRLKANWAKGLRLHLDRLPLEHDGNLLTRGDIPRMGCSSAQLLLSLSKGKLGPVGIRLGGEAGMGGRADTSAQLSAS